MPHVSGPNGAPSLHGNLLGGRTMSLQVVDLGPEVDRIADTLESIQITWVSGLAAGVVFIAGLVAARLARRSIRALGERTQLASPQLFLMGGRIVFYVIVLYALSASMGPNSPNTADSFSVSTPAMAATLSATTFAARIAATRARCGRSRSTESLTQAARWWGRRECQRLTTRGATPGPEQASQQVSTARCCRRYSLKGSFRNP